MDYGILMAVQNKGEGGGEEDLNKRQHFLTADGGELG